MKSELPSSYVELVYSEARTPKTDYPAQLVNHLQKRFALNPKSTLLELGSGRGEFLKAFKALGFRTISIDREIATELQGIADEAAPCDLSKDPIPLADASVDVIFHKSVLEHLHDPYHLMTESLRVLRPGGTLIVMTPEWASTATVFYEDFSHVHPYTTEAVRDLMLFYKLDVIAAEKFRQLPVVWNSPIANLSARILSAFLTTTFARTLTKWTGIKFFRWSTELMVLAAAKKK